MLIKMKVNLLNLINILKELYKAVMMRYLQLIILKQI